jgi:hypothetical protein
MIDNEDAAAAALGGGHHQVHQSYTPEATGREIAKEFRRRRIPSVSTEPRAPQRVHLTQAGIG